MLLVDGSSPSVPGDLEPKAANAIELMDQFADMAAAHRDPRSSGRLLHDLLHD
eukprot:gene1766-14278_t